MTGFVTDVVNNDKFSKNLSLLNQLHISKIKNL